MQKMMNRREFIRATGILGVSAFVGASLFNVAVAMPVKVQGLFSMQKLANGIDMPLFGFLGGKHKARCNKNKQDSANIALEAFNAGYRLFETCIFGNDIGDGLVLSQVRRQEVFLTLRLPKKITTADGVLEAFNVGLAKLKTDYIDLLLIEIPEAKGRATWLQLASDVWGMAEELYRQGRVKAIGVANLTAEKLLPFLDECQIKPMVNKIELSPFEIDKRLVDVSRHYKMVISTDNPYGSFEGSVYDPIIQKIAKKYGKTETQVILRWSLQMGFVTLASASDEEQVKDHSNIFDFSLSLGDMKSISRLQENSKRARK